MSFLALYGTGYNQIARAVTAPTPESADSLYPIANLYDGWPSKPFRFAAYSTSSYIDFDLQQAANGDMEAAFVGGLPAAGWSKSGTVTCTRDTGVFNEGAASCKLSGAGSSGDGITYDVSVAAGEVLTLAAQVCSTGGGATIAFRVRNLATGNYLQVGDTWGSAVANRISSNSASWSTFSSAVTVESYSACGYQDRVTLQLQALYASSPTSDVYVDGVLVYPRINFASVHGHNIQPNTAPIELRGDATSPASTARATFTLSQPTMFSTFVDKDYRYWRLFFTRSPLVNPTWLGEVVLGQYQTLRRRQNFGQELTLTHAQDRDVSDLGPLSAYVRQEAGRRRASISFRYNDDTDYEQAREIVERSKGGAHPLVLVLESGDETMAMLGRISPDWKHTRETNTMRDAGWELEELPFPVVLP